MSIFKRLDDSSVFLGKSKDLNLILASRAPVKDKIKINRINVIKIISIQNFPQLHSLAWQRNVDLIGHASVVPYLITNLGQMARGPAISKLDGERRTINSLICWGNHKACGHHEEFAWDWFDLSQRYPKITASNPRQKCNVEKISFKYILSHPGQLVEQDYLVSLLTF